MADVDLSKCNLEGVDLRTIHQRNLSGCKLEGAVGIGLTASDWDDFMLAGINMTRFAFPRGVYLSNIHGRDLSQANLRGCSLVKANLTGICLRGSDLTGVDLSGAILNDADLSDCVITDGILAGASMNGANLTGVNMASANMQVRYLTAFYPCRQHRLTVCATSGGVSHWGEFIRRIFQWVEHVVCYSNGS